MATLRIIRGGRDALPRKTDDGSMADLLDYEIFARVIKAGSLSAAARELNSTPAMISKRLTRLEDRLGVKLLHRTTRRLTATEVGQSFYDRVLTVLAAVDDAESVATSDNLRPRGLLRISLPTAFGRLHVAPRLKCFLDQNPELKLLVDLNDDYVDLVAGAFDVAVRIGTLPDSGLIARRLAPNRRVLCAAPAYLEKYGVPRTLAELHQHRVLAAAPLMIWRFDGPTGPTTFKPQSSLQTNSSEVVREAVVSGLGIGFRSTWDIGNELKLGALVRVLPEYSGSADVNIYCVYAGRRLVPPKVRVFVDYCASVFGGDSPYWDREIVAAPGRVA